MYFSSNQNQITIYYLSKDLKPKNIFLTKMSALKNHKRIYIHTFILTSLNTPMEVVFIVIIELPN